MSKKHKLPKRIAGIKIPKALRKGSMGRFMASPLGREAAAAALIAAAGALSGSPSPRRARSQSPDAQAGGGLVSDVGRSPTGESDQRKGRARA